MKKDLIIKIVSLTINLFLFVSSTVVFFRIIFAPEGDLAYFRHFTNLSNIYMGIISLIIFIYTLAHFKEEIYLPKWLRIAELAGVAGVMLTFLTVILFLVPVDVRSWEDFINMYKNDMFFFHFLNPLLAFFSFLFFVKGDKLTWKEAFFGMIPMVTYSLFYVIFVFTGFWGDFYGFTFGGNLWAMPLSLLVMYIFTYLVSFLTSFIYNKIENRRLKKN